MSDIKANKNRKIVHIDMDAFYASVEQRDFPELKDKAIAVGGGERRGVITTASYEARKYGVKSAMPGFKAKALCPHIIFVPPRFDAYIAASKQIRAIFKKYTDLIEPLSLDEAFLDVTKNKKDMPIATELAQAIKDDIYKETQLSCSAGVSYCKFIAKLASDIQKPNGLTVIKPSQAEVFLENLAIEKFFGIGKVTARRMKQKNIHNGKDLKAWSKLDLAQEYGKAGRFYYDVVRGIDNRPVRADHVRKSIGVERTLQENISDTEALKTRLRKLSTTLFKRLEKNNNFGRTITLKLKTKDFQTITRSLSKEYHLINLEEIQTVAIELFEKNKEAFGEIRLIGLSASNLQKEKAETEGGQISFDF